jgi:integrase
MAKAKKLPSGSWRVQLYVGADPVTGKRKYKSFTADTKKEAEYMAAQYQMGIEQEKKSPLTFLKASEEYIELRSNVLSPWTITSYRRILYRDLPPLHSLSISDVDQDTIQRFINIYAIDHSPKSVRNVHGFISCVLFKHFPNLKLSTQLPGKIKHQITIPTDEQILSAIHAADGYMPLIIRVASSLGLRRAEICALTWSDISGGMLNINKAMAKTSENEWVIKSPKSFAGTRTVTVPSALLSLILASRQEDALDTDRIFPVNPDYITKHWYLLCKSLGFSCRFHDLRHYNASVMLSLGVPDKYAMQRMGHATTNMLKTVYQHLINEKEKQEYDKIDSYMAKFSEMQHEMQHENKKAQ